LLAQALEQAGHSDQANEIYQRLASSPNLPAAQKKAQSLLSGR